jgi:hypothetical protein
MSSFSHALLVYAALKRLASPELRWEVQHEACCRFARTCCPAICPSCCARWCLPLQWDGNVQGFRGNLPPVKYIGSNLAARESET